MDWGIPNHETNQSCLRAAVKSAINHMIIVIFPGYQNGQSASLSFNPDLVWFRRISARKLLVFLCFNGPLVCLFYPPIN